MSGQFIYVARHAWAHEFGDPRWPDDSQRALEEEGSERYMRMIESVAERGFAPEAIATSPYLRCRQTAEIISQYTAHQPAITELDALAPGSNFETLVAWSQETGCQQTCWVGHAPDVGNLTSALVGDNRADIRFAKSAIAAVRLYDLPGYGCGELYWLVTAKSLGV
ncbi:MAG: histidine phosphatase family protein [Pirellulales bacterium]|nr:histidine phosphatase family protein [Pirellulales bacterium]